jgi:hypothetical protein
VHYDGKDETYKTLQNELMLLHDCHSPEIVSAAQRAGSASALFNSPLRCLKVNFFGSFISGHEVR